MIILMILVIPLLFLLFFCLIHQSAVWTPIASSFLTFLLLPTIRHPDPPPPESEYNARIRGISASITPQQSDRHRSYSFSGLSTVPRFEFHCTYALFLLLPLLFQTLFLDHLSS